MKKIHGSGYFLSLFSTPIQCMGSVRLNKCRQCRKIVFVIKYSQESLAIKVRSVYTALTPNNLFSSQALPQNCLYTTHRITKFENSKFSRKTKHTPFFTVLTKQRSRAHWRHSPPNKHTRSPLLTKQKTNACSLYIWWGTKTLICMYVCRISYNTHVGWRGVSVASRNGSTLFLNSANKKRCHSITISLYFWRIPRATFWNCPCGCWCRRPWCRRVIPGDLLASHLRRHLRLASITCTLIFCLNLNVTSIFFSISKQK